MCCGAVTKKTIKIAFQNKLTHRTLPNGVANQHIKVFVSKQFGYQNTSKNESASMIAYIREIELVLSHNIS